MIRIEGLKKQFGGRPVLKGIDLHIPKGQATAIVGPNGSGKTTMIKTILGLVKPDAGRIEVNGTQLNGHYEYRHHIGYMPQVARYPENMQVHELFDFIKDLRGREPLNEQELIERFNLEPEMEKPLRVLSGGYRQKVGACLALMFNPEILIMDEPTAGLDPKASHIFKELIQQEKAQGKTILLTSHIMSELEELTDHVIFILEGKIRFDGPIQELIDQSDVKKLEAAVAKMMDTDTEGVPA